jgi:hypothetical protein
MRGYKRYIIILFWMIFQFSFLLYEYSSVGGEIRKTAVWTQQSLSGKGLPREQAEAIAGAIAYSEGRAASRARDLVQFVVFTNACMLFSIEARRRTSGGEA